MKVSKVAMAAYTVRAGSHGGVLAKSGILYLALEKEHDARDDRERIDPFETMVHDIVVSDSDDDNAPGGRFGVTMYVYEDGPHETIEVE